MAEAAREAVTEPLAWRGEGRRARKRKHTILFVKPGLVNHPSHTGTCNLTTVPGGRVLSPLHR